MVSRQLYELDKKKKKSGDINVLTFATVTFNRRAFPFFFFWQSYKVIFKLCKSGIPVLNFNQTYILLWSGQNENEIYLNLCYFYGTDVLKWVGWFFLSTEGHIFDKYPKQDVLNKWGDVFPNTKKTHLTINIQIYALL